MSNVIENIFNITTIIDPGWIFLLVRIVLGSVMVYYGYPKIRDLIKNAQGFEKMGLKPGKLWGTIIAIVEYFGGLAVLIGIFPQIAAALFGFEMILGAVYKFKNGKPFSDYSYDLQLFTLSLVLIWFGPGIFFLEF